jgi:hypothetical protein
VKTIARENSPITKSNYAPSVTTILPSSYDNVSIDYQSYEKKTYSTTSTITLVNYSTAGVATSFGSMFGFGTNSMFISSFQLYIEAFSPKIEFVKAGAVFHTIQTTANYLGSSLKTFQVPNIDISQMDQVWISSSSLVNKTVTIYGIRLISSAFEFLFCNITYATQSVLTPLTLFNIPNPSSTPFQTTLSAGATINQFGYTQTGLINYKPYYITIPSITLSSTGTPLQLSFSLFSGLKTYVTTTFSISSSYTTGLTIPLQSNYTGTGINTALTNTAGVAFTVTYPTTNAANAAPYLEANAAITGTLTYTGSASTIQITTAADLDSGSGWIVNLYGTDVIIDPTLAPSTLSVKTPITYSTAKTVGFTAATTTAPHAGITYTIYPTPATPTTTTTLTTTIATIPGTPGPNSFKLNVAPESGNGNVTIYANSSEVTGYKPKSMYAQSTVKNYVTLPSGKVVPFANTYNAATVATGSYATAVMRINFTQNVILNALDFGYIFETFIKNGANPNITNNGGYTATGTTTTFSLNVGSNMPYINYGSIQFTVTPNQTGNVYSALHTSSSNADGSNDGTLLSIPFTPTPATATATVSGGVISCTITNGGSGYIYPPSVIVTGTPNTAIAYATINSSGSVTGITFTSGNNGYGSAPTIAFQVFNTARATAVVSASGVITATITNGGSGYVYPPEVVISGVPNTATATATISAGSVTGITIISGNTEYSTAPTIAIIVFRKATATAAVNNGVITATITNGGSGYVYPPQVVVEGAPNTATATATINSSGSVTGITFTSGNAGYSTAPIITFLYSSAASAKSEPETMSSIAMATSPPSFPTYVSGFTTDINSPFAFNVGDEIIISLSIGGIPGGSVWTTPTTSTLGVQTGLSFPLGEMCGSLICTPNTVGNPTYNPPSAVVYNAPGTTEDVMASFNSVSSPPSTLSGTIILTGFRFSGITISQSGSTLPAETIGLRADIYRGASVIFQVFFNYIESSSTAAPLYIPFSYAEYASVGTANPTWVSRIVPTSMYFNQPQNPIFYTGEICSIKLVNTSSNTSLVCTYRKNVVSGTTYASGTLWGISENLPTITTPSPIITPIFYNGMNITYVKIPKPVSTNTTSGFTYVASSAVGSFTTTDASNNCMLGINPSNYYLLTTLTLKAYQSSSTTYSKSSVISYPNTVQMINTTSTVDNIATTFYSIGKSSSLGIPTLSYYNSASSTATFTQAIGSFNSDSRIAGFSFQYFGGFAVTTPTQFQLTVYVLPPASSSYPSVSRSMAFTVSNSDTTIDKNGTMTFIPFNPTFYDTTTRPTNVTNITYDNSDMYTALATQIVPGAIIRVSMQVLSGGGSIAFEDGKLAGSLILRQSNNPPLGSKDHSSLTISMYNMPYSYDLYLFNDALKSITSRNNLIITHIRVPGIIFNPQYPVVYPATIRLTLSYRGLYNYTITCKLISAINSFNATSYLELTMPTPSMFGSYERRYDYGFYIEKINATRVGTFQLLSGINFTTSDTSTYSSTRYSYSGDLFGQTSYPIFNDMHSFYYNGFVNYSSNPMIEVTLTSPLNPIRPVEWDRPNNTNCALRVQEFD